MTCFRRLVTSIAAAILGFAAFGSPSQARADFTLKVQINVDNAGYVPLADTTFSANTIEMYSGNYDLFTIMVIASANPMNSFLDLGVNTTGPNLNGAHDIYVQATVTGLNTAPGPQTLDTVFAASSMASTGTIDITNQTWVANSTDPFTTTGPGIVKDSGSLVNGQGFNGTFPGVFPYSWTTQIHIVTSAGFDGTVFGDSTNNITATPAPSGLVLALGAASCWGDLARLRRRIGGGAV